MNTRGPCGIQNVCRNPIEVCHGAAMELLKLSTGLVVQRRVVGPSQMRHDRDQFQLFSGKQIGHKGILIFGHSESTHARVEFQVHGPRHEILCRRPLPRKLDVFA